MAAPSPTAAPTGAVTAVALEPDRQADRQSLRLRQPGSILPLFRGDLSPPADGNPPPASARRASAERCAAARCDAKSVLVGAAPALARVLGIRAATDDVVVAGRGAGWLPCPSRKSPSSGRRSVCAPTVRRCLTSDTPWQRRRRCFLVRLARRRFPGGSRRHSAANWAGAWFLVRSSASSISCCRCPSDANFAAYSNGATTCAWVSASRLWVSASLRESVSATSSRCWMAEGRFGWSWWRK